MRVYVDCISGDEFLSDEFLHCVIMQESCIVVKAKWIESGTDTVIDLAKRFGLQQVVDLSK